MFCPEGYHPLAELWRVFRERRLRAQYEYSAEFYASDRMAPGFVRGSPLDICEHVFLKSASICGLWLASPVDQVMRIHAPLEDGVNSLCSALHVLNSSDAWLMAKFEEGDERRYEDIAGRFFQAWDEERMDQKGWMQAYPVVEFDGVQAWRRREETLRYHTLPLAFERERFVVVQELPSWTKTRPHIRDLEIIVSHFAGWSLCMSDAAYQDWKPYLDGRGVYEDEQAVLVKGRSGGRPGKQADALRDYRLVFPNGHQATGTPWKVVRRRIATQTGNKYSESTLRRALKADAED